MEIVRKNMFSKSQSCIISMIVPIIVVMTVMQSHRTRQDM